MGKIKNDNKEANNNSFLSQNDVKKQNSNYRNNNRCEANNNDFFEERSNPLSSKGN